MNTQSRILVFLVSTTFAIMIHVLAYYLQFKMPRIYLQRRRSKAQKVLNAVASLQTLTAGDTLAVPNSKVVNKSTFCGESNVQYSYQYNIVDAADGIKPNQPSFVGMTLPFERLLFIRKFSE